MDFSYSDTLDMNEALTEYKKENPNSTEADINTMKDNMLAELWNGDQHEKLKQELKDHLYRLSTYAHNNALDYSAGGPGAKKPTSFTITPFNRKNIVKNTNGKPIYRTLEEAISDLFGSTRPENSENNKAKYD